MRMQRLEFEEDDEESVTDSDDSDRTMEGQRVVV